jgi:hypothetical protein
MKTNTTRRAVLAGIAAAPALAAPSVALGNSAGASDQVIFAAIERHRAAQVELEAALDRADEFQDRFKAEHGTLAGAPDDPFGEIDRLQDAHLDVEWELASTTPQTAAGLAAVLRYLREDGDRGGALFCERYHQAMFHCSIEDFVCDLAGLPAPETARILDELEDDDGASLDQAVRS